MKGKEHPSNASRKITGISMHPTAVTQRVFLSFDSFPSPGFVLPSRSERAPLGIIDSLIGNQTWV